MAHDVAREIVARAQNVMDEAHLKVDIVMCKDHDYLLGLSANQNISAQEEPFKSVVRFRNMLFESHTEIQSFRANIFADKSIDHEGFRFYGDFEKVLACFLYQYVMHALYVCDILQYEVVILSITDSIKNNTIQMCFHLNLSDISTVEVERITGEILDKVYDPLNMVLESWIKNSHTM